jgi:diguanylate cyclase (GGDEF)-like protein
VAAALLEALPPDLAVLAVDADGRLAAVFGGALRRAGWPDGAVGCPVADVLCGAAEQDAFGRALARAREGVRSRLRLTGGSRAWQVDAAPLAGTATLVVINDITAVQQALRLHDARARAAELIAEGSEDLPARLVREVAPVLRCRAAVYWETGADGVLQPAASWVPDPAVPELAALVRAGGRRPEEGLVATAYASRRWQVVPDLRAVEPAGWVRAAVAAGALGAAAIPALRAGAAVGVFEFFAAVPLEHDPDVAAALTALSDDVASALERRAELDALQALADHDGLTGLLNRRRFEEELRHQAAAAARYGRHAALLVLDLDDFKAVNDRHGHAVGDELLRRLAGVLRRRIRATDWAARLGGDEFAVILDGADLEVAARVADQLAGDIAAVRLAETPDVRPAASVGVAAIAGGDGLAALRAADQAMYAAKRRER